MVLPTVKTLRTCTEVAKDLCKSGLWLKSTGNILKNPGLYSQNVKPDWSRFAEQRSAWDFISASDNFNLRWKHQQVQSEGMLNSNILFLCFHLRKNQICSIQVISFINKAEVKPSGSVRFYYIFSFRLFFFFIFSTFQDSRSDSHNCIHLNTFCFFSFNVKYLKWNL